MFSDVYLCDPPCLNGASCIEDSCVCAEGYSGLQCEGICLQKMNNLLLQLINSSHWCVHNCWEVVGSGLYFF